MGKIKARMKHHSSYIKEHRMFKNATLLLLFLSAATSYAGKI